jgi:hypothetical protein
MVFTGCLEKAVMVAGWLSCGLGRKWIAPCPNEVRPVREGLFKIRESLTKWLEMSITAKPMTGKYG